MERVSIILLAAGNSRRFGENKMLYQVDKKPMYRHVLDHALRLFSEPDSVVERIVLVSQYREIRREVEALPILYIENSRPEQGISHSLHLGLQSAGSPSGYIFAVCDQPFLTCETFRNFVNGFIRSGKSVGAVEWQGELYNPCGFRKWLSGELLALKGDGGGKKVVKRHMDSLFVYPAAEAREVLDLDVKAAVLKGAD